MTSKLRTGLFLLVLAALGAGCGGLTVRFKAPADSREKLERSMRLTYTFQYETESKGFFSKLFSPFTGSSIENPRLLYNLGGGAWPRDKERFVNTGAAFDDDKGTAIWQIVSPKRLHGKKATFVITGDNVETPATTSMQFPTPGRVTDVSLFWKDNRLAFRIEAEGAIYDPAVFLKLWNRTERPITTVSSGEGVYTWDYPGEIKPSETRTPISFKVTYKDWYKKNASEPFLTTPIYIAPAVTFDKVTNLVGRKGQVEVIFRAWGKTGLVRFEYSRDGKTFQPVTGMGDPQPKGESFRAVWDLGRDELAAYTGALTLVARSGERLLGKTEVLPPGPSITIGDVVQEDDILRLPLRLAFVPAASLQVFAGKAHHQRELRTDELLEKKADGVVIRHRDLPREADGRLYVFVSARNAAGVSSAETIVRLLSVAISSARQNGRRFEMAYSTVPANAPVTLSWTEPGSERTEEAKSVTQRAGRLVWDFMADLGTGSTPTVLKLSLRAGSGKSFATAQTEAAPLGAVLGTPKLYRGGTFVIPASIFGAPDWIEFSYQTGSSTQRPAKHARYLPAKSELHWPLWADVKKSAYRGQPITLRVTLKNRYGQAAFEAASIRPLYVRILRSAQAGQEFTVWVDGSPEVRQYAFAYAFANRGEFRPVKPVRREGKAFTFDLSALGRGYSNFVRIRVTGSATGNAEATDTGTVRLMAGFEPSAAAWHGKYLWVSYTVGWRVSEDDVTFRCAPRGDWTKAVLATTPMKRIFNVNNRACAWDVLSDMVRLDVYKLEDIAFRIDIRDPEKGPFFSVIGFDRLPKPPLRLEGTSVRLSGSSLSFGFRRMVRSASLPPYSVRDYKVDAEFLDSRTGKFRAARRASGGERPGAFVWDRKHSFDEVRRGTWVRLLVSRRNDPQVVGFTLFRVKLAGDHAFFQKEEEY